MEKNYKLPEENNQISEPITDYETHYDKTTGTLYDILDESLLKGIAQAEDDIANGRVTPLSEIKKKNNL